MNLKKLIKESGLTNKELAQKMSVSEMTISRYVQGHKNNPEMLERIAKALGKKFVMDIVDIDSSQEPNKIQEYKLDDGQILTIEIKKP